jgi:hypothetical protein
MCNIFYGISYIYSNKMVFTHNKLMILSNLKSIELESFCLKNLDLNN